MVEIFKRVLQIKEDNLIKLVKENRYKKHYDLMIKKKFLKFAKQYYYNWLKIKNGVLKRPPILVLMYHRVDNESDKKMEQFTVSLSNFEQQMQWIKTHFPVIKLKENWSTVKKASVVITFDDGYANNFINALPILEKYNIPATLFITTLNINKNEEFWWDKLASLYEKLPSEFYMFSTFDLVNKIEYPLSKIKKHFSSMPPDLIMEKIAALEKFNFIENSVRPNYFSLNKQQLKSLNENDLIDIGIHTHQHIPFEYLSDEEQLKELNASKAIMSSHGVEFIPFLALPNGSYTDKTLAVTKKAGFEALLLANNYYSSHFNKQKQRINRILVPDLNEQDFKKYLNHYLLTK